MRVYPREGSPTQQVIEVNNIGANSCGLSYFPLVFLGNSSSANHGKDVHPLIPSGLGGAPAYPVKPRTAALAVIDLNPSGANAASGALTWINELNVIASDHLPNAETQNFPLGEGVEVLNPKLGLYDSTIDRAVKSMTEADAKS
ncbi:hypothetical protein ACFVW8_12315 [Streptomyces sp. NPDC058221]|uniref:hypothetical protein n=1 Tax=Streptomyces sp. NPDC058221 TaxID=3346388 RepID=UPI0036E154F2